MWDLLSDRKRIPPRSENEQDAVDRFNDVMICKRMHWTPEDIARCPADFYRDMIVILGLLDAKEKQQQ